MIIGSTPTHPPLTLPFVGTYVSLINSTGITRGEDDDDELDNQRRKGWVDSNRLEVGNIAFIMALSRQIIGRGQKIYLRYYQGNKNHIWTNCAQCLEVNRHSY